MTFRGFKVHCGADCRSLTECLIKSASGRARERERWSARRRERVEVDVVFLREFIFAL